jgi:hypothetical protein
MAFAVAAIVAAASAAGAAGRSMRPAAPTKGEAGPPTVLVTTKFPIEHFAQDGARIAWTSGSGCAEVHLRSASGGKAAIIDDTNGGDGCYHPLDAFAVAGRRVLWGGIVDCCIEGIGSVFLAAPGRRPKELRSIEQEFHSWGDFLTGASGDGATLVFSIADIYLSADKQVDPNRGFIHCLPHDPCTWEVGGGGVWRVVGRSAARVPGAPPTVLVAASKERIALVPAAHTFYPGPCTNSTPTGCPKVPHAASGGKVEIRDAESGAVLSSFAPPGRVTALAFAWPGVAVLVRSRGSATIATYDGRTGALRRRTKVPVTTANELDLAGGSVVFRVGQSIRRLSTATGRIVLVANARSMPVGLSVEGRRIAWAEKGSEGVIRQVLQPTG